MQKALLPLLAEYYFGTPTEEALCWTLGRAFLYESKRRFEPCNVFRHIVEVNEGGIFSSESVSGAPPAHLSLNLNGCWKDF